MDLHAISAALNKDSVEQSHEDDVHDDLVGDDFDDDDDGLALPDYDAPAHIDSESLYRHLAYTLRQRIFCHRWDDVTLQNPYAKASRACWLLDLGIDLH